LSLSAEFFYFLLVASFVVIESVLDGQNIFVDGDAIAKKLNEVFFTFYSWSICPCRSWSFSCNNFSSIYRYLISSCSPVMYWSSKF